MNDEQLRQRFLERYPYRTKLAEILGIYSSDLSAFLHGKKKLPEKHLKKIEEHLNGSH